MRTVGDLLAKKSGPVFRVDAVATVLEAAKLMNEHRIGAVVVTRGEEVVGIFSERDVLNRIVAAQRNPGEVAVGDVMTTPIACCTRATTIEECRSVMTARRIRHLPVVEDNKLLGLISSGDIMAQQTAQQQETIRYLHEYLYGNTR
jgi:CBS domain-containing protein